MFFCVYRCCNKLRTRPVLSSNRQLSQCGSLLVMRLLITILAIGFLAPSAVLAQNANTAPDWSLLSAQGEKIRLADEVQQQPVILLFWATWCPYCKALMPHLQSMHFEYGDKVKILAINFVEKGDPVEFIRNAGYDFTVLPDGDAVAAAYDVYGTPGVIIVDQEQIIRFDLRTLPGRAMPPSDKPASHGKKAAYQAPYWAAAIRMSVDQVLGESTP